MLELDATTARLRLRPFRADDLDDVHAFQSDAAVLPYIPWEVRSREESAQWLDRVSAGALRAEGDHATWAIERRVDHRVLGAVNLSWTSREHAQAEFGFVLASLAWGHGYAAEAVTGLLAAAFPALDLHRAYGRVDARNAPSLHLLARMGLRQEGVLRGRELFKGEWTDIVLFAVLRAEWEARQG